MHTFDYKKYKEHTWDNEIVSYVSQIHEYRGKQDLYIRQKPVELERCIFRSNGKLIPLKTG